MCLMQAGWRKKKKRKHHTLVSRRMGKIVNGDMANENFMVLRIFKSPSPSWGSSALGISL